MAVSLRTDLLLFSPQEKSWVNFFNLPTPFGRKWPWRLLSLELK
jgi:hypothetical protein